MGRKAHRISPRQPGRRNIIQDIGLPAFYFQDTPSQVNNHYCQEKKKITKVISCQSDKPYKIATIPKREHYQIVDNTKPSARVGRKAHWVSPRQPGRRNITMDIGRPAIIFSGHDMPVQSSGETNHGRRHKKFIMSSNERSIYEM
jgi:hypothetical protein